MAPKLQSYDPKYDWVLVESQRKHSIDRREWNNRTNMLIAEGEEVLLPRGSSDPDEDLTGMKYYFKNGFYKVIDADPDVPGVESSGGSESSENGQVDSPQEEPEQEDEPEQEQAEEEMEPEESDDPTYQELQKWAGEREDVAGNQPYDELLEAYQDAENNNKEESEDTGEEE